MSQHILCVSYDDRQLLTRRKALEQHGYQVTSALGFKEAVARCQDAAYDLFILGHSIPFTDKQKLIETFRAACAAPILSLWRQKERILDTVEYLGFTDDPDTLLQNVATIFMKRSAPQFPKPPRTQP